MGRGASLLFTWVCDGICPLRGNTRRFDFLILAFASGTPRQRPAGPDPAVALPTVMPGASVVDRFERDPQSFPGRD